ncbi:hypothetical protein EW145_g2063 [Phellinidium pouzarii]|uniref:Uncharacterized protein n=1 Tax=Phellinidium pouzarii TaxID=167371 RepID=A0A4S4LHQ2_9AGAM|nr:hypothetical protein EW145_g2063 [Phellinidium pouzarii]
MSQRKNAEFESVASESQRRRLSSVSSAAKPFVTGFTSLTPMWAGIAGSASPNDNGFEVSISIHDSVYNTDFASTIIPFTGGNTNIDAEQIEGHVIDALRAFSSEHLCKFLGAGVTLSLLKEAPNLCTRLWLEMDIVPVVFNIKPYHTESLTRPHVKHRVSATSSMINSQLQSGAETPTMLTVPAGAPGTGLQAGVTGKLPIVRTLDEQADSAARKCLMYYGPNNNPRLTIGPRNQVTVDAGGKIHLIDDLEEYEKSVGRGTWNAVNRWCRAGKLNGDDVIPREVLIGSNRKMRHALIRFLNLLDVDAAYVPNPSPSVFRTTKNNHNILQGVAAPDLRLTQEAKDNFDQWIYKNGLRWTADGGPLAAGGVDVAFIDDPQMPGLIPMIKKSRPGLPIVYRSHIEIRSDLTSIKGSPQEGVWEYLWKNIQLADLFISHPVSKFVPKDVPMETVALLGAATDFLDGLNKDLAPWDSQYYMGEFRSLCAKEGANSLKWPARDYVIQVARFDPSKGIPDVIDSYFKFRKLLEGKVGPEEAPQLLICGHGAVDDPDASIIYDQVIQQINSEPYVQYASDIVAMRLPPSDQRTFLSIFLNAKIALQLSSREGFEVKVSEALHAGKPVVAFRTGGIPLQIQHGKSGYLCEVGDNDGIASYLLNLYTDKKLYATMSEYARTHVSDEVGTVGNAAAWLYLAAVLTRGTKLKPNGAWLNDLLRAEAGEPYQPGEPKLPREGLDVHA